MIMNDYKHISLFKGLNALRCFAAFLVVMHHSETIKRKYGLANVEWLGLFRNGSTAVIFFFVLSGFLITYLLLKETAKTGTVSVRNFYLKRVLRIWPLYALLVIFGALILPQLLSVFHVDYEMPYTFSQVWAYFVFFVPGLVTFFFGHHFLEPLWSIGVEEVFYLIWAPIFKVSKGRILKILLAIIAIKAILLLLSITLIKNELFYYIVYTFQFEAMAVGGLGAYFLYHTKRSVAQLPIFAKPVQVLVYVILAAFLIFNVNIDNMFWNMVFKTPVISQLLIDLLFLYLIIGVSVTENSIIKLNNRFLSYLGEISYGIYMYHMLVVFGTMLVLKKYLMHMGTVTGLVVFYPVVFILVIIVASLSKKFFENYFLRLKDRLQKKG